VDKLAEQTDMIFHLAAAVGVELIVNEPFRSLTTNIRGSEIVLEMAYRYQRKVLITSTSEIYGKNASGPLDEEQDRILGSPLKSRWSYSTAKSVDEGRQSLLMSAFFKIPLQALILLTGVLVFVFYLFNQPPMLFNPVHEAAVRASARAGEYAGLEQEFTRAFEERRSAAEAFVDAQRSGDVVREAGARDAFNQRQTALGQVRRRTADVVKDVSGDAEYRDVNYVFPTFVTTWLPVGLVGLMIAAIFAAAMSSVAAELNSLSTATVIDFYRRTLRPGATDRQTLVASKIATGFWGLFASVVATYAVNLGALIEVVNRLGSFFYGSLFGVFLLAIAFRRATAAGAFWGLIAGMSSVAAVGLLTSVAYLWQNVVGTVVVVIVGLAVSAATSHTGRSRTSS